MWARTQANGKARKKKSSDIEMRSWNKNSSTVYTHHVIIIIVFVWWWWCWWCICQPVQITLLSTYSSSSRKKAFLMGHVFVCLAWQCYSLCLYHPWIYQIIDTNHALILFLFHYDLCVLNVEIQNLGWTTFRIMYSLTVFANGMKNDDEKKVHVFMCACISSIRINSFLSVGLTAWLHL